MPRRRRDHGVFGPLRRRALPAAVGGLAAIALTLCAASPSSAEEVFTSQAAAAHATDSTWIPAPPTRAAVCIIDTGNDPNPDTTNVIARLSVDNGDGLDRNPGHHGTLMSMIASAPYNGFGMVGAAPSINVVSVRASRDGTTFAGSDLTIAIQKCRNFRTTYNIKVISLSLGGEMLANLDASAMASVENNVNSARAVGINVVAAAGNHVGGVDWPSAYGPVFAVGAADDDGARCSFAAFGPEVDLWAPGCPVDAARPDGAAVWAQGSSESTAFVAGALTQLRQLSPDLSVDQAEQLLAVNAAAGVAGPLFNADRTFRAAGMVDQLALGHAHASRLESGIAPTETPTETTPVSSGSHGSPATGGGLEPVPTLPEAGTNLSRPRPVDEARRLRLPRPRVRRWSYRRRVFGLVLANRPSGVQVDVRVYARKRRTSFPTARLVSTTGDRLRTRVSGTLSEVSITYVDPTRARATSASLIVHPKR
ncbi:MAG: hypothetical protein JWR63_2764 [Conexibacter sp.]|nr:hypothetical protein [Conexibacter sp.]